MGREQFGIELRGDREGWSLIPGLVCLDWENERHQLPARLDEFSPGCCPVLPHAWLHGTHEPAQNGHVQEGDEQAGLDKVEQAAAYV